jgi:hypothetical protein
MDAIMFGAIEDALDRHAKQIREELSRLGKTIACASVMSGAANYEQDTYDEAKAWLRIVAEEVEGE